MKELKIERTISTRPVTFECRVPGHVGPREVTEDRFPGPMPTVCKVCKATGRYKAWRLEKQKLIDQRRARNNQD